MQLSLTTGESVSIDLSKWMHSLRPPFGGFTYNSSAVCYLRVCVHRVIRVFPRTGQFRTLLNSITSHFFQRRRNGTCEHSLDSLTFCALGSGKIPMFVSWNNFLANVFHAKVSIARCSVTVEVLLDMVALRVQLNTDSPYNLAYPYTTPGADQDFRMGVP